MTVAMTELTWGDLVAIVTPLLSGAIAVLIALWKFGAQLRRADTEQQALTHQTLAAVRDVATKVDVQAREIADVKILAVEAATRAESAERLATAAHAAASQAHPSTSHY